MTGKNKQTSSGFGHMLSVGTIHLEDRFCASRKGGIGEVGRCDPPGESTWCWDVERPWLSLSISHFSPPLHKQAYKMLLLTCRSSISVTVGSFQSEQAFAGRKGY